MLEKKKEEERRGKKNEKRGKTHTESNAKGLRRRLCDLQPPVFNVKLMKIRFDEEFVILGRSWLDSLRRLRMNSSKGELVLFSVNCSILTIDVKLPRISVAVPRRNKRNVKGYKIVTIGNATHALHFA